MGQIGDGLDAAAYLQPPFDNRLLVKWLENQSEEIQSKFAREKLEELLTKAAQPRHVSGNACIKLCHFIEQCKSSDSFLLRGIAYSKTTCLKLFSFYIEWNEKNQHRSMRQVVELLSSLIDKNPDQQSKTEVKTSILERSMSILTHQAAQPLVKPAFKALECLLSKRTISTQELIDAYRHKNSGETSPVSAKDTTDVDTAWDSLFADVFEWMILADISPAAGKFLVTVFRELRSNPDGVPLTNLTASWQRWIREGLRKEPEALENVKNYLFPPLFKLDRPGSLLFLEDLNTQSSVWDMKNQEFDAHSLLQLAAIETGKKSGLVEEPSSMQFSQKAPKKSPATIILQEESLYPLLAHASDTVRSLAFSVLVSSNSTIRPFSLTALNILQSGMSILYCDSDAKFRNEVLSNTKHMIERLRGALALLMREIESLSFQLRPEHALSPQDRQMAQQASNQTTELLRGHASFIEWYIEFLLGELIPTASYQRHITALKAISLLLRSGILKPIFGSPPAKISDNSTVWPCVIDFFNPMSMRLLLDLLMDPFEDVRSNATSILKLASPNDFSEGELVTEPQVDIDSSHSADCIHNSAAASGQTLFVTTPSGCCEEKISHVRKGKPLGLLRDFVERAKVLSKRTGRADYADGVARSTSLLFGLLSSINEQTKFLTQLVEDLETELSIAEDDLAKAVLQAPVHGTLAALNFVWDSINHKESFRTDLPKSLADTGKHWDSLQLRIAFACTRIWDVVKDILCNDSPEGHLPQDLDEGDFIDTKDVLSYSFRAVHESSNLLQTILDKIRLRWEASLSPPPLEIFTVIGDLTFLQLSTLRHRGAFSTVSLAFTKCCVLTQVEPRTTPSSSNRLQSWYEGALRCVREQPSTTRRSAGIPALFTAIMAAQAPCPSFEQVMVELMTLAGHPVEETETDGSNIYQVHALNSMKEIFKSTALGKRSEQYIPQGLELAVYSLQAPTWSIRNSGLILFRSIMDRLFGTSESKAITESGWDGRSIRLFYDAYPNLPQLIDELLNGDTNYSVAQPALSTVELIFPALDIIRRAGPPASHATSIRKSVIAHLGSPVWNVREIAAHTVCTFMLGIEWKNSVLMLLETPTTSANQRHGLLLASKYILERRVALNAATAIVGISELIPQLRRLSSDDADQFKSSFIINAHIELSISIAQFLVSYECSNDEESAQLDQTKESFWNIRGNSDYPTVSEILRWFYPNYQGSHRAYVQCFPAMARLAVYKTGLRRNQKALCDFVRHISKNYDSDVQLAATKCILEAWKGAGTFSGLCDAHSPLINSEVSMARTIAYNNLSNYLDKYFSDTSHLDNQKTFWTLLNLLSHYSPASFLEQPVHRERELAARIKFGAWLSVAAFQSSNQINWDAFEKGVFRLWSHWLTRGGEASNPHELRRAVASGLSSFYGNLNTTGKMNWEPLIPSLLALYNSLNDDDEEIRIIAASAVSSILKTSLAPPAASEKFVDWLNIRCNSSPRFIWNILYRMTGSTSTARYKNPQEDRLMPFQTEFKLALKQDDSLFAQEEQNLFIDDVREISLWGKLLQEVPCRAFLLPREWSASDYNKLRDWDEYTKASSVITEFAVWVADAITVLHSTMRKDGPLGWTSKPLAFKAAFRVLHCANVLLDYHDKYYKNPLSPAWTQLDEQGDLKLALRILLGDVSTALETFRNDSRIDDKDLHPILIQELYRRNMKAPVQSSVFKKISLLWKSHGSEFARPDKSDPPAAQAPLANNLGELLQLPHLTN